MYSHTDSNSDSFKKMSTWLLGHILITWNVITLEIKF